MAQYQRRGKWLEVQISGSQNGITVEEGMKTLMGISGRMIQRLTRINGIQVNGKKSHLNARLKSGDRLQVSIFEKEDYGVEPEAIPIDVLFEDEHILVVNKQPGIAVHPTEPGQMGTLAHGIAFHYQLQGLETKVRHIHRLDKDTSGVLMVAKHGLAQAILDADLREKKITRTYIAVAAGIFKETKGTINLPIGRDRHHPTRRRVSNGGDPAVTHYEVIEQYTKGALVRLHLETGRTHQIRVHLSHIGHPLYGDGLYGGPKIGIERQALHGERIHFHHPFTHQEMEIAAPIPDDLKRLMDQLRFS